MILNDLIILAQQNQNTTFSDILKIISIFILMILVFFGAFYTSKLVGKQQMVRSKAANMKIVEAISVGPQKTIQLIKVGKEYILVGVTKDRITYIKEISESQIDLSMLESVTGSIPFSKYMEKLLKKDASRKNQDKK